MILLTTEEVIMLHGKLLAATGGLPAGRHSVTLDDTGENMLSVIPVLNVEG